MRKSAALAIALVLAVCMMPGHAAAQEWELGVEYEAVPGVRLRLDSWETLETWDGEISDTHGWLVLRFTLTNFNKEPYDARAQLGAELTYPGGYGFTARVEVVPPVVDPLVRAQGAFVFRVPTLVTQAGPYALDVVVSAGSSRYALAQGFTAAPPEGTEAFFPTAADAVLFFHVRVREGDFAGMLDSFAVDAMAQAFDYAAYLSRIGALVPTATMPFPDGFDGAYLPLNAALQRAALARQAYFFLISLLAGPEFAVGGVFALKDGMVKTPGGSELTPA